MDDEVHVLIYENGIARLEAAWITETCGQEQWVTLENGTVLKVRKGRVEIIEEKPCQ